MTSAVKKSLQLAAVSILLALAVSGLLDRVLNACGLKYVQRANAVYLDDAFDKALSGFLMLSGIKSGLAVIEGSEVGVGFNLQIGDVVQPLYDYVDIAWRAALAGGSIIAVMQLSLRALEGVDHWALSLLLAILLGRLALGWIRPGAQRLNQAMGRASRLAANICAAFYLLLPLTVTAAALVSQQITAPVIDRAQEEFAQLKRTVSTDKLYERLLDGQDPANGLGLGFDLKNRLEQAGRGLLALLADLQNATGKIAAVTVKMIAAYVFDCILFPLFFGLVLMTLIRSAIAWLFEIRAAGGV